MWRSGAAAAGEGDGAGAGEADGEGRFFGGVPCPKSPQIGVTTSRLMTLQIQLDAGSSQPEEESSNELENALIRLEEEQQR